MKLSSRLEAALDAYALACFDFGEARTYALRAAHPGGIVDLRDHPADKKCVEARQEVIDAFAAYIHELT